MLQKTKPEIHLGKVLDPLVVSFLLGWLAHSIFTLPGFFGPQLVCQWPERQRPGGKRKGGGGDANRTSDPGLSALSSLQLHMTEGHKPTATTTTTTTTTATTIKTRPELTDRPSDRPTNRPDGEWGPLVRWFLSLKCLKCVCDSDCLHMCALA